MQGQKTLNPFLQTFHQWACKAKNGSPQHWQWGSAPQNSTIEQRKERVHGWKAKTRMSIAYSSSALQLHETRKQEPPSNTEPTANGATTTRRNVVSQMLLGFFNTTPSKTRNNLTCFWHHNSKWWHAHKPLPAGRVPPTVSKGKTTTTNQTRKTSRLSNCNQRKEKLTKKVWAAHEKNATNFVTS